MHSQTTLMLVGILTKLNVLSKSRSARLRFSDESNPIR